MRLPESRRLARIAPRAHHGYPFVQTTTAYQGRPTTMLSRRQFATGIVASLAMATQLPQSASAQPAARPRLIVDAQVHIWQANSPELPWVPGANRPGPVEA